MNKSDLEKIDSTTLAQMFETTADVVEVDIDDAQTHVDLPCGCTMTYNHGVGGVCLTGYLVRFGTGSCDEHQIKGRMA